MTRALAIAALHLRVHSSSPSCLVEEGIHYQISREFFGHVLTTGSTASNSCRAMMTLLICVCVMCDHPHVDDDDDDDRLRIGLLLEEAAWTRAPSVPRWGPRSGLDHHAKRAVQSIVWLNYLESASLSMRTQRCPQQEEDARCDVHAGGAHLLLHAHDDRPIHQKSRLNADV
jgi:hypothetical protein